jgi:hypothetical protein
MRGYHRATNGRTKLAPHDRVKRRASVEITRQRRRERFCAVEHGLPGRQCFPFTRSISPSIPCRARATFGQPRLLRGLAREHPPSPPTAFTAQARLLALLWSHAEPSGSLSFIGPPRLATYSLNASASRMARSPCQPSAATMSSTSASGAALACTTCASADAFRKPRPLRRASRANAVRATPSFGTKTGALATFSVRHPCPYRSQRLCARLSASLIFMVKSKTVVDGGPLWPSHEISDRPAGPNSLLGSDLVAFLGAGPAGFAAGFAFGDLREFFTFFLAVPANHRDQLGEMASMLRIDRRQRLQGAASGYERNDRVGAPGHARVLHRIHAKAVP